MEKTNTGLFDLSLLIKQGHLSIRDVAAAAPIMTTRQYFNMLSELIGKAPVFLEDLNKLIARDADRYTFKRLTEMVALLTKLGFDKDTVTISFDGLLDAYDRGHSRLTVRYATKIINEFKDLISGVMDACVKELPESCTESPEKTTLKEWVEPRLMDDSSKKPVIFAVDDSPVILRSVSSLLSSDYKVYLLAKSTMLEKILSQVKPDLFLLDYNMPGLNGFELIPIIRSYREHKYTPIIFLTSEGTIDHLSGAVKLGACDFIVKPVHPTTLREKVAKHITKKREALSAS